jgi:hypothetical protein
MMMMMMMCLISEKQQHLQQKTTRVANKAKKVGLNIKKKKMKIMRVNTARHEIIIDGEMLEDVDKFCYLGSMTHKMEKLKMSKLEQGKPKTHLI